MKMKRKRTTMVLTVVVVTVTVPPKNLNRTMMPRALTIVISLKRVKTVGRKK